MENQKGRYSDLRVRSGILAAVSRIAAILPSDLAPTNMNGPLRTLNCLPSCRGAALRTGLSLQLQNFRWANSHNAGLSCHPRQSIEGLLSRLWCAFISMVPIT